jgi:uncharacterized membrane protein (DUF106 family)
MKIRSKVINLFGFTVLPLFIGGVLSGYHFVVTISLIISILVLIASIADVMSDLMKDYRQEKELNYHLREVQKDIEEHKKHLAAKQCIREDK